MMDSLFRSRVLHDRKQKWQVYRTILDWTIWLYLLIPASIFLVFQYVEALQNIASWGQYVTPLVLALILTIIAGFFSTCLYIEEADTVFLMQKQEFITQLKNKSLRLSLRKALVIAVILFLVLLPILTAQMNLSWLNGILTLLYFWQLQTAFLWMNYYIPIWFSKRLKKFLMHTLFILGMFLVSLLYFSNLANAWLICLMIVLLIALLFIGGRKQILQNKYLVIEIQESENQKLWATRLALQQAGVYTKNSSLSQPIFNWAPSFFKTEQRLIFLYYVRSWQKVRLIFRMTGICLAAIFLVPIWIKFLIFLFYIFFLWNEIDQAKQQFHSHPFARMQNDRLK